MIKTYGDEVGYVPEGISRARHIVAMQTKKNKQHSVPWEAIPIPFAFTFHYLTAWNNKKLALYITVNWLLPNL